MKETVCAWMAEGILIGVEMYAIECSDKEMFN